MKALAYLGLVGLTALVAAWAGFSPQQGLSITVFASFIVGTLLYWPLRLAFACGGITILLAAGLVDVPHLIEFASLDVILFLIATMIIIGFLEGRNYFEWTLGKALPYIGGSAHTLMIALMVMAFVAAALVGEVTSVLFMVAIALWLARHYQVNPIPFVIMLVFATNIGSSATVIGNPIGVLIALRAGLTFPDFLRWATPISVAALVATVALSFLFYKGPMEELNRKVRQQRRLLAKRRAANRGGTTRRASGNGASMAQGGMLFPTLLLAGTVAGLMLHGHIENVLGLARNTMLVGVALLAAALVLLIEHRRVGELVVKKVDWRTLAFFTLLFAAAGTLHYVGATDLIAGGMVNATRGQMTILLGVIIWSTGLLSAVMDNVLAVASFVPIVDALAAVGVNVSPLWWGMLFGGTVLGNLTLVGSTANIVALGLLEREGRHIGFMQWFWPGLVTAVPSLLLATLLLYIQLPLLLR